MDFRSASLEEILSHKTMYYDKIDFSIVKKSWQLLSKYLNLPYIIHIVGTNGKGSTGRFLSHHLVKSGFKTLHYSSPHILEFNERIWINGKNSTDFELEFASKKLQTYLPVNLLEKLTYFEYTTLLSFVLSDGLDYLVLEAGLGGEFDATNVVPSDLSLITTIGIDHQSFLGNTIEEIARTKMRSVDKKMLIGYQEFCEVYDVAKQVKKELKEEFDLDIKIQKVENFENISLKKQLPIFLKRNLSLVVKALEELNIKVCFEYFEDLKLFGRCEKIKPNITIDVGHNPLAAKNLADEFKNKKITLVYNSYKDKDYKGVLEILKPIINEIIILPIDDKRMVDKNNLLEICKSLNIIVNTKDEIRDDIDYLIFGSFLVVENFLKNMGINER